MNGARPVLPKYVDIFQNYFHDYDKKSWFNFAPFLISYHLPPNRRLEFVEEDSTLFIYQITRSATDNSQSRIDLFTSPCPLSAFSVNKLSDVAKCNAQSNIRILWTDQKDLEGLQSLFGHKIEATFKDEEYIYDPRLIFEANGSRYKDLRKKTRRVEKLKPVFRELRVDDLPEAYKLLKEWRRVQGRKRDFLLDWGYTNSALERQFQIGSDNIFSWCVEIDNCLQGFAMAGPISKEVASFFIIKTNLRIDGLSEYLRWKVCGELQGFKYLNDAGDLCLPGLRQHKVKMRPIEFNKVSSVKLFL